MSFREPVKSSLFSTPSSSHSQGSEQIVLNKLHYFSESELFTLSVCLQYLLLEN